MTGSNPKTTFLQKILLIGLGLLILLMLEFVVRITGFVDRSTHSDPFVGFEKVYPLFGEKISKDDKAIYATNENKLSFFNYLEFEKEKPTNTFRIFCFGGSTTYGRPFRAETAFPRWLEINLNLIDTSHNYQVINAGGISYASYRIVHLVEEATKYEPDLFILYMGHNEFLEARTYENILTQNPTVKSIRVLLDKLDLYVVLRNLLSQAKQIVSSSKKSTTVLENEVATILDASAGLERYTRENLQIENTIQHYRYNLKRIIDIAHQKRIKFVLTTLTSNLKDFSPFKSQHREGLAAGDLASWNNHYQKGQIFQKKKQYKQALIEFEQCMSIDNQYAKLVYNIAQCLYHIEQYDLAKKYYHQAKELDICPLRAQEEINSSIRLLSRHFNVPLVDIEAEFEKLSSHGIPDGTYLIDHVHPTIAGNQIIAAKIAEVLQTEKIVQSVREIDQQSLAAAHKKVLDSLPDDYFVKGMLNLAKVLGWAGKEEEKSAILFKHSKNLVDHYEYHYMLGNSLLREGELDEAITHFKKSINLNPGFSESYTNLGFALERSGSPADALNNYKKSLSLDPEDYVAQTNIGRIYYIKGEYTKAITEYKKAIEMKSDYPHAHEGLGVTYYRQGNTGRALEELNLATELNPNYAEAYYNIGMIYLDQRKIDNAITNFKKAISSDPYYADAHSSLGVCYYHKKMLSKAIKQLKIAIDIDPKLAKVHNNLAIAYHSAGNYNLAWQHIKAAQNLSYTVHPQFIEMLKKDSGTTQ